MNINKGGRALIYDKDKKVFHVIDGNYWHSIPSDKILDSSVEIEGNSMIIRQIELVISMEHGGKRFAFLNSFYGSMTGRLVFQRGI